jgi:predicted HTH transcriptional regulator
MKESNRIEFKRQLSDDLEKELVAFLNYREGGKLYIGIDDDGNAIGVRDLDAVQLKIKDRLKNNILPSCMGLFDLMHVQQLGKDIILINIASGPEKPYYIKKKGMSEQGCFIRSGSAADPMPVAMIEDLFSKRTRNSLGKIVSNRQDLRFEQLKIYYNTQGLELNSEFLRSLDFYTPEGKFNYVAYLLADNNALSMKVAKYAGKDKTELIENMEFGYNSIVKATHSILDKLEVENKTFVKITGAANRLQKQMIDKTALREALINAIVHNDYTSEVTPVVEIYSDRLSITSYGGLVQGLSKAEFFAGRSMPRNRELMRVYRDLRLVEQLGSGIHRILKVYKKDIFTLSANFLEISFPFEHEYDDIEEIDSQKSSQKSSQKGSQKSSQKILELIGEDRYITTISMAEKLNISRRAVAKQIAILKENNHLKRIGPAKGGYWEIVKS